MTKSYKLKRKIIILSAVLSAVLLTVFLIIPYTVSALIYGTIFGRRYSTTSYLRYELSDFDGLQADRYEFKSHDKQTLVGYRYSVKSSEPQGVVVIAHGLGGGGHNSYMDVAYYFVRSGYDVFAYDATGNDESGGKGVNGLPNGVIDLHYALEYLKEIDTLKDLPVMLWGHSWGGYCVGAILTRHPEVRAVASVAGFNCSSDLIEARGVQFAGEISKVFLPYVKSIERIKFGNFALATAMDGFARSDAGVFIAHSDDDDVVPIKYGFDIYFKKYSDNSRFKFVRYADKGHSDILYSYERINYMNDFYEAANAYFGGKIATDEERLEYVKAHLDRYVYCDGLDKELFSQIVDFYNSYLPV